MPAVVSSFFFLSLRNFICMQTSQSGEINPSLSPETVKGICYPLYWVNFAFSSLCTKWSQAEIIQTKTVGTCWQGSWGNSVTRGLRIETWIGRCNIFLSSFNNIFLNYYAWFFYYLLWTHHYLLSRMLSIYGWQMHILLLCYSYLRHHLFLFCLVSNWSQQSRKMTEINRKLGIYNMCNWNWEESCLTWNIRSTKCVLQHRPNSILTCCASSFLGWECTLAAGRKTGWGWHTEVWFGFLTVCCIMSCSDYFGNFSQRSQEILETF